MCRCSLRDASRARYRDALTMRIELVVLSHAKLRDVGCFMLGQVGKDRPFEVQSVPLLVEGLASDESIAVQAQCAAALGHLKADEAVSNLIQAARSESADICASVAAAIGHLTPSHEMRELLSTLLADDDNEVREWAEVSKEIYSEK